MQVRLIAALFVGSLLTAPSVQARTVSGPIEAEFIDFEDSEVPTGAPADGLSIGGLTFSFGGGIDRGSSAIAEIGFFPLNTPHTSGKGIVGPTFGILGMHFARPVRNLSFGFALEGSQWTGDGSVRDGVVVDLFDPEGNFLGTYKQDAEGVLIDERGGGAEYASARFASGGMRIGSAAITFPTEQQPLPDPARSFSPIDRFILDNISFDIVAVPLPTTGLLGSAGLLCLAARRRRSL